jgi:GT2 family glycosyltransferase
MAPPDEGVELSVGIVTFNRAALLDGCLASVRVACAGIPHEVIVVDNRSVDGTVEMVRSRYPEVTLLINAENVGLTRAANQAIARARGRWFLLLDNDTAIDPTAVAILLEFHRAHPKVGVVAPKLVYADGTEQGAAKAFPTPLAALFGRKSLLRRLLPNNPVSRRYLVSAYTTTVEPFEADSVSAACMLLRRETIAQVGGLDEGFFVYWSDVDWCRRIKEAGWPIYVVPTARVVHFESQTYSKATVRSIVGFHQGVYRYYCKHHARARFHPMRAVALVGLTARAALTVAINRFRPAPPPPSDPTEARR